jgi:hypothetical protein
MDRIASATESGATSPSELNYEPLYRSKLALVQESETPVEDGTGRLQSIIDASEKDATTDSYVLLEVPFDTEAEAIDILEMADSMQQRIFMNASDVEMRSTAVRTGEEYRATLIVKPSGFATLNTLYGNDYQTADPRSTEQQCARLFESEFALMADNIAQHRYAKQLPPLTSDTDTSEFPPYYGPEGVMTVYFVGTKRGHEIDLNGSSLPTLRE